MFRRAIFNLHMFVGLVAAVILFIQGLTGAALVFENEIDVALNRGLFHVELREKTVSLDQVKEELEAAHPGFRLTDVRLPAAPDLAGVATLKSDDGKELDLTYDPYTGRQVGDLIQHHDLMLLVHQFHTRLSFQGGSTIVAWASVLLIGLSLTGIVLWWPRKIVSVSWSKPARRWFDLHNAAGFFSAIFLLLFALSGAIIHWDEDYSAFKKLIGFDARTVKFAATPAASPVVGSVSPEQLAETARNAAPGARLTWLQITDKSVRAVLKYPEDRTPAGRTQVMLDPHTGALLSVTDTRKASAGFRLARMWNREVHTGDIFGWPTRIVAFVASLALCLLAFSGPLLWWRGRKRTVATAATRPAYEVEVAP